jgi:hypothetical protein
MACAPIGIEAGGRLAHLLLMMEVKGMIVVVTRWFGGIQLGPDRFKHINTVARMQIEEHTLTHTAAAAEDAKRAAKRSGTKHTR